LPRVEFSTRFTHLSPARLLLIGRNCVRATAAGGKRQVVECD
jgi:hypothetical protein